MKYYKIEAGIANPNTITEEPDIPTKNWFDDTITFRNGQVVEGKIPKLLLHKINHPEGTRPEPFLEATYPVVNDAFIDAMKRAGVDNFQLFPACLESEETGEKWKGYYVFNVVRPKGSGRVLSLF